MELKIPIHVSNQKAYIWDVKDAQLLRSEHRICGLLSGTLPHLAQQNVFLGVPLNLMPEEVVLLIENHAAILVDNSTSSHAPTQEQLAEWALKRERDREAEVMRLVALKENTMSKKSNSETAMRKRLEREARKAELLPSEHVALEDGLKMSTSAVQESIAHSVVVPTSSRDLPWFALKEHSYDTLDNAREAGVWVFPSNLQERARCGVFRALWEKGYYLGNGVKFGGEYLVYPGDPLRYHSHFAATVHSSPQEILRPMEVVAHGRLGTATKKAHVMCAWDDISRTVQLFSIEWAGFG